MMSLAYTLVGAPLALFGYSYVGYPLLLRIAARFHPPAPAPQDFTDWPAVTVTLPVYNEARSIRRKIEEVLALDYPRDRLRVLVISDCSSDATDDIAREYVDQGVSLVRLAERRGKTAAENAAAAHLHCDIVVNTDATTRLPKDALRKLVRAFVDPTVGAASGRDVSIGDDATDVNSGETGYVGYEMQVRALETRLGSIVGVSGCFYGIRRDLYASTYPEALSRDFGCALGVLERGARVVSVDDAICYVPRAGSLQVEYRRKIRTMQRGLRTLWYKRALLDPFRYGRYAWMLTSHKLCRWLVPLTLPLAVVGLALLSADSLLARVLLAGALAGTALGAIGMRWPETRRLPRLLALPAFFLAANVAGMRAWREALRRGGHGSIWEPTRRPV